MGWLVKDWIFFSFFFSWMRLRRLKRDLRSTKDAQCQNVWEMLQGR